MTHLGLRKEISFGFRQLVFAIVVATFVGRDGVLDFGNSYPGAAISDSGYVAGYFSAIHTDGLNPFSNSIISSIAWPMGLKNHGILNITSSLSIAIQWLLTGLFNPPTAQLVFGYMGVLLSFIFGAYALR